MSSSDERTRTSGGRYVRSKAEIDRDADAAELRGQNLPYRAVAEQLGISVSTAHARVGRAFRDTLASPAEAARAIERDRIGHVLDRALEILEKKHVTVSHGHVVHVHDEETGRDVPLADDGPALAAIDRIIRASESLRRLDGLDAPKAVKMEHTGDVSLTALLDLADTTDADA